VTISSSPSSPSSPRHEAGIVERLRAAGCVFAEDEARLLVSEARTPSDLAAMVDRRVAGVPLEHVLGWAEFCGLRVAVDPGVFVPRRRTEFLVHRAVALARPGAVVLDMCCGSGAVGAALAAVLGRVELHAADVDPAAVACARRNLAVVGGRVYEGDLFAPLPATLRGRVDVLVANAPYVPTDAIGLMPPEARLHEARVALDGGADGLDVQRRVTSAAPQWLAPGGFLVIETSEQQAARTAEAFAQHGLLARVARCDELSATVVIGTRPATPSGQRSGTVSEPERATLDEDDQAEGDEDDRQHDVTPAREGPGDPLPGREVEAGQAQHRDQHQEHHAVHDQAERAGGGQDGHVDGDVVAAVGEGHRHDRENADLVGRDPAAIVVIVGRRAPFPPRLPSGVQPEQQREEPEPGDDRLREETDAEGGADGDGEDGHEPDVLPGNDAQNPAWPPGDPAEQQGQNDDVVDVGDREQADRLTDQAEQHGASLRRSRYGSDGGRLGGQPVPAAVAPDESRT
jgi:release factor glutamine methyltransferase